MNLTLKKELPIIGIVLTPFVYLALIWKSLPEKVPTHWNIEGKIDNWGDRSLLILLVFMLPVLMYLITIVAEKIDPKKRIALMGSKFYQLKFFMVLFMSLLALFFIYISKNQNFSSPNLIYVFVGVLLMVLGNYFKVIQPNYFIGIRTPWTLENREVWKATHVFAGKIWFLGGIIIVLGGLVFPGFTFSKAFISIGVTIALVPIIYSYFKFQNLEKNNIS
ncbi:putative membrane protein [Flavobacterium chryseum]|uniref:SdpI family protein n=1 Tax=Flavobacterium sp. P3160 TaxID=2512113 RepID=UPI00105F6899|nr:SdpI family protein [Flavobacterium sp. P3160]TDO71488.1 putative membrane protein [Flavobacterium sp. P3160]